MSSSKLPLRMTFSHESTGGLKKETSSPPHKLNDFVRSNALQPGVKNQILADLGYYESGFRDPLNQQSKTIDILLSGDEKQVKAEYNRRRLGELSRKQDGSKYYEDAEAHLMAQVLHSHERLAEVRRQVDFLEDFVAGDGLKVSSKTDKMAGEIIKETDDLLKKAKDWKIKSTYRPRFDTLLRHIEGTKERFEVLLKELKGPRKRAFKQVDDTEMTDVPQTEHPKKVKRHQAGIGGHVAQIKRCNGI